MTYQFGTTITNHFTALMLDAGGGLEDRLILVQLALCHWKQHYMLVEENCGEDGNKGNQQIKAKPSTK